MKRIETVVQPDKRNLSIVKVSWWLKKKYSCDINDLRQEQWMQYNSNFWIGSQQNSILKISIKNSWSLFDNNLVIVKETWLSKDSLIYLMTKQKNYRSCQQNYNFSFARHLYFFYQFFNSKIWVPSAWDEFFS